MIHRTQVLRVLVFICLFIALGCTRGESPPKVGELAPRIDLDDLKGNRIALQDDLRNKIVIIRFWGDCCSYNINEMSRVDQLYRKYEKKGLRIVTIYTGRTRTLAEHYASTLKIKFPILLDPGSKTAKRYGVSELPCTFILDQDGVIRTKIIGLVEGPVRPTYERIVTALLE